MKPFISIIGGKTRRAKRLAALLPPAKCYVEVFGGSAAVLFAKEPSPVEVYNDADGGLVNLFKTVQGRPDDLSSTLKLFPASRRLYYELVNGEFSMNDPIWRAAGYYFVLRTSFSCKPGAGFRSSRSERSRYSMVVDFEEVIEKYDGEHTVFFVDPPYPGREGYYNGGFEPTDHLRLRDVLVSVAGKWLLTYADIPEVRESYRRFNMLEEAVPYSASLDRGTRRPPATELVIANYDIGGD
jgi:DNA adenine methylase